jgi:hypothetical protein
VPQHDPVHGPVAGAPTTMGYQKAQVEYKPVSSYRQVSKKVEVQQNH